MKKNDQANNSVKMLAIDIINKANTRHMGLTLGLSSVLYSLYLNELNILPSNPNWINRDRLFIANNNISALYYSMLYHAGYQIELDDLKRFTEMGSIASYGLERNVDLDIEATTRTFGSSISMAVGSALAERYFSSICRSVDKKSTLIDHYTYVLCSDKDLENGESYEALSYASTQRLGKLIIICALNKYQNDSEVEDVYSEDIESRFDALDYNIIFVKNANNINEVSNAINNAKKGDMPSVIFIDTKIGFDAKYENTKDAYTKDLSQEEIISLKQKYNLPSDPFDIKEEHKKYINETIIDRVSKYYKEWENEYLEAKRSRNKDLVNIINLLEKDEFHIEFDSTNYQINSKYNEEGTLSNNKVMNFIAPKTRFFMGGSADLSNQTKAIIETSGFMSPDNPSGRNLALGNRQISIGNIVNGISLFGIRSFVSTNLVHADYLKPAMRQSAIMRLPVTYLFMNDSMLSINKGPVYQPVEQLTMLRTIPNMTVFRPCDINEIIGAWEYSLKHKGPVSIVISSEKMHILKHTNGKYVKYGAYIVRKERYHLDGIIIASGYEVQTALRLSEELFKEGIDIRVVSMPCYELFLNQNHVYEEKLLPDNVKKIVLEASSNPIGARFATDEKCLIDIKEFGTSASKEDVAKYAGFDDNTLLLRIKKMFE